MKRWQSAGELREALESTRRKKFPRGALAAGLAAAVLVVVALTWFFLHRPPKPSAELTQKRLTFNSSENPVQSAAISPDGKYLAYSDPAGIHVKLLSTGEERLIPRPAGVPAGAYWWVDSWFPDGTQLLADATNRADRRACGRSRCWGNLPRELREGAAGIGGFAGRDTHRFQPSSEPRMKFAKSG